ncbi:ataxin-10 [Zophobas morio]|uniref:ataxin-10 n=1 Tax=Zophobas morio TaxID=2755281 RepID=UPI003082857B
MSRHLDLNVALVDKYLKTYDYPSLANYLNISFKLEKGSDGIPLQFDFSDTVLNSLHKILLQIINEEISENHQNILKELFRSLRNYVINIDVQKYLSNDSFLNNVKIICESSLVTNDILQVVLQFLINLVVSNEIAAKKVYAVFQNQIFGSLKQNVNTYENSALLYNISLHHAIELDFDMYVCILQLYDNRNNIEFLHFLIEKFITYDNFWTNYKKIDLHRRLVVLGVIREKQIKGEKLDLCDYALQTLSNSFINSASIIFQTVSSNENDLEPYEVSELLQVISSLSSDDSYLKKLQNDKDLLINVGVVLINIHKLGKDTENYFSSIQSLSEVRQPTQQMSKHPAFGFKADLIRIIGNLCWKNRTMQDLVREAELIPVVLECCNMDARNPFIMQWGILAVRNLCENNLENQKIIAGLHQEGTVSSTVLEEMGLTLHSSGDENGVKIVPLDALRNHR